MPGAKKKLLDYFLEHVGIPLSKNNLASVASVHDWARVIRTLRQEGWDIILLENGDYVLRSSQKSHGHLREKIDQKTRYRILQRDYSTCQRCGKTIQDGVKLMIDHKLPVDFGGKSVDENLWALCAECNLGKKHWFTDNDPEVMKRIFALDSGYQKLKAYFESYPNVLLRVSDLNFVSGIRDWERTLRLIRRKEGMNIEYISNDSTSGMEGYMYVT